MATPLVFVHGTFRRLHGRELHALLAHHARFEGEGSVQAQLFNLGDYPGLVRSRNPSDRVLGEVYRLEPSHLSETLREMDEYEGIGPKLSSPPRSTGAKWSPSSWGRAQWLMPGFTSLTANLWDARESPQAITWSGGHPTDRGPFTWLSEPLR